MSTTAAGAVARLIATGFKGRAKRLDNVDLPRLGYRMGVGEDEVHAFIDVETSGGGFDKQGRPKALYEPHRAYALSTGAIRTALVEQGLAYPKWGERPYPTEKEGGSYPRILTALAIEPRIALEATSWGLGQIMGSNHVAAGYESAAEMVAAFLDDEEEHLAAAVSFIRHEHLDDELRAHNWAAFARGYNGPGYARNGYDTKLKAAYQRWTGIPDTAWSPGMATLDAIAAGQPAARAGVLVVTHGDLPTPARPPARSRPVLSTAAPPAQPGFWGRVADRLRTGYPPKPRV